MAKRVATKGKTKGAASAAPSADKNGALTSEAWPFGTDRGPVRGWLKAILPQNIRPFQDFGTGHALYPAALDEVGKPAYVQPDGRGFWTCSNPDHKNIPYGCSDIWEHRFRLGDLKRGFEEGRYVAPIRAVRVTAKKGGLPWDQVERYLPRPNPTVDGIKAATLMKHARIAMCDDSRTMLAAIMRQLRRENVPSARERGRPQNDIYDVAFAAILRGAEQFTYEQLDREIRLLHETEDVDGPLICEAFKHPRVIEAMNGVKSKWYPGDKRDDPGITLRLSRALDQVADKLRPLFSKVSTVAHVDGMVLSTAATDSARRTSYSKSRRAMRVVLHVLYEHRWGFIMGWRLTWHNRGRGSAEAPQFPYLLKTAKKNFPLLRLINGDGSYGSDRNFALATRANVQLISLVKDEELRTAVYLTDAERRDAKALNSLDSALFKQFSPFRNRGEGWHETQRHIVARNLLSEPDRSRYPATTAKDMKKTPNAAEATLPEDQAQRDQIIVTEQFVGRACDNEMRIREIVTLLRATVKAQRWYKRPVDFAYPVPFEPRPEDEAWSMFRPRLSDDVA